MHSVDFYHCRGGLQDPAEDRYDRVSKVLRACGFWKTSEPQVVAAAPVLDILEIKLECDGHVTLSVSGLLQGRHPACQDREGRFPCCYSIGECSQVLPHLLDVSTVGFLQPEDQSFNVHPCGECLQ